MKVILLNGSPHEAGCTYTALMEVAKVLEKQGIETELFQLGKSPVAGCTACGACAKGKKSHVLTAMGLPNEIIDKSIRISFSRFNTKEDVDLLASSLDELVKTHPIK